MIFAFLPPYVAHLIWDGCGKKIFFSLLVQIENMVVFPNILFSRITFINFYKKVTNKCSRIGPKQISFVCSMTSQVTSTYYLLLNSVVNC